MRYQSVEPISRSDAESIFAGENTDEIVNALLSVAYHDPDWRWVQNQCLQFLDASTFNLRRMATLCLGHVGRIHGIIDWDVVVPRLVSLLDDPELAGTAEDALSDISIFVHTSAKGYRMEKAQVNGTEIAYEVRGMGEPLLMIHGAGIPHDEFQPQYETLGAKFRLILPDVRGHGESPVTKAPYSMKQFADDMFALLEHLGIDETLILGHSMGGTIAQQMVMDHPERVKAMVLAETNYGIKSDAMLYWIVKLMDPLSRMIGLKRLSGLSVKQFSGRSPQLKPFLETAFQQHVDDPANFWNISQANNEYDGKGQLAKIQCPTLIMAARNNPATHSYAQYMAENIPNARLIMISNAGHMLNWDNAEVFNKTVIEFFEKVSEKQ
jgi:3-oxoadipate enol-lactonase